MKFKIKHYKLCKDVRQILKIDMLNNEHNFVATSRSEAGLEQEKALIKNFSTNRQISVLSFDIITKYGAELRMLCELIENIKC